MKVVNAADIDGTNGFRLTGGEINGSGGLTVASAGDLNGDGIDDIVIGLPNTFGAAGARPGVSYVIFGQTGANAFGAAVDLDALDGTDGFTLTAATPNGRSGTSVAAAGDVNGDGIDDLLIGARDFADRGRAHVVFGKKEGFGATFDLASLDGQNGFTLLGRTASAFGAAVSGIGDFNGDGVDDILVGDPQFRTGLDFGVISGHAFVLFGRKDAGFAAEIVAEDLDGENGLIFTSFTGGQLAGAAVSGAGDFNGDGIDDFIVGGPGNGGLIVFEGGAAFIVFGADLGAGAPATAPLQQSDSGVFGGLRILNFDSFETGDPFIGGGGGAVGGGGDINGDGFDDVIIGASGETTGDGAGGAIRQGAAIVLFGGADRYTSNYVNPRDDIEILQGAGFSVDNLRFDGVTSMRINGENPGDQLGHAVSIAGDVNGDGLDDLLIGAFQAGSVTDGVSYVVFGRTSGFPGVLDLATLTEKEGFRIDGVAGSATRLGVGVSGAGDVNGDGIDDLIVQARANGAVPEQAFILFGARTITESADDLLGTDLGERIDGLGGEDTIRGLGGDDTLIGGAGNDRLEGGPGVNRLEGGTGTDTAVFAGAFAAYSVSSAPGGVTLSRAGEATTALSVETFLFADGARSLASVEAAIPAAPVTPPVTPPMTPPVSPPATPPAGPTTGDDVLRGTGGPDRIAALAGDDTVRGRGGDDTLLGQRGDDVLRGGGGDDSLKGGGGSDRMFGQGANDTLKGGGAGDFLKGGGGADRIIGGGGADTIEGNKGADTLIGGAGADLFRFKPGDGADVIQRFQQGRDQVEFKRGVADFGALTIEQQGDDVLVTYKRGSILFENQNANAFAEDDFIF